MDRVENMIIFKQLKWVNFFSYGSGNEIDFTENPVSQLVGLNGAGKTSIALIIQEILYGKNVKKIIKANLKNRNRKGDISAELRFDVNNDEYIVQMRRGTKLFVSFFRNDEDISSHTAAETMKSIENVLNIDFDTFSQLVYQSSKSSLQFLTATDTQRKKFLINLFNLEEYITIFEKLKTALVQVNRDVSEIEGKYSVYENWIKQHKDTDLSIKELEEVPVVGKEFLEELAEYETMKAEAAVVNKQITTNNSYKQQLSNIDSNLLTKKLHNPEGISELESKKTSIATLLSEKRKTLKTVDGVEPFCRMCKQPIDIADSVKLAEDCRSEIEILNSKLNDTTTQLQNLKNLEAEDAIVRKATEEFENLSNLIDNSLPAEITDIESVNKYIMNLKTSIANIKLSIDKAENRNKTLIAHNSKVKVIKEQLDDYNIKLLEELNNLEELFDKVSHLEVLKDAFSTNGLVSYKLEYLVKDLEIVINEYLEELSKGRFQLNFILKDDKLNIEIADEGNIITINELSEGELAKVNVSTVLAIRKLMQNLSNTKLNLLFLDEIMGVLDEFGRDDLINVLLAEESLNTFLVTHQYTHPLVPILNVLQEEGISRIENG
jgi:DNA repair exonuclease SbcCD ATPase subunit